MSNIFSSIKSILFPPPGTAGVSFIPVTEINANDIRVGQVIDFSKEIEEVKMGEFSYFPKSFLYMLDGPIPSAEVTRTRFRSNARTRIDFNVNGECFTFTLPDEQALRLTDIY